MFASDLKNLQEAYENLYEESDLLTDDLIEEIVEELVEECVEFGYDLNESADAVEAAAILYINEAKVTYGSDTESPEQRRERAKAKVGEKRASARKAAVKGAVERVKAKAKGAVAGAGIAGSIAKDEARRAGRAASHAVQKKKAEVKGGIKKMIGGGLRAAAGGLGKVAKKAAGAASRLGEEVEYIKERDEGKPGLMFKKIARKAAERYGSQEAGNRVAGSIRKKVLAKEEVKIYDVVLEYLMSEGHADTIAEAEYIMTELDSEMVNQIVETSIVK